MHTYLKLVTVVGLHSVSLFKRQENLRVVAHLGFICPGMLDPDLVL